ncbi:alpha/beta hydrolase [Sphingomonas sp. CJ99]
MKRLAMLAGLAAMTGCAANLPPMDGPQGLVLYEQVVGPRQSRSVETLFVVLNGDGAPQARGDEDGFIRRLAEQVPGSAVVHVLRPGYADISGHRSPGTLPAENGDQAATDAMMAVADTLRRIERRYPNADTVLIGSGGGAAIIANLAGTRPQLLDGMVLVSCPCTLPEWRRLRARQAPGKGWDQPVEALDPLLTAGGVPPDLLAAIITGSADKELPPRFSRSYAEALALRGINTDLRILPDKAAPLLNEPEVLEAAQRIASRLPKDKQ